MIKSKTFIKITIKMENIRTKTFKTLTKTIISIKLK